MSSTPIIVSNASPVIVSEIVLDSVKSKKPVLPAKYSKNVVFGFWLIQNLQEKQLLTDHNAALDLLQVFSDVSSQKILIDGFFEEVKVISKNMKILVRNHNKPSKTKNIKNTSTTATVQKRGRKVKIVESPLLEPQQSLIANLVAAANTDTDTDTDTDTVAVEDKKVKVVKEPKEPKEKVVKEPKEKVVKEPKEKVVKEPKEKVVKEPKEKVVKEPKEKVVKEPKEKVVKEPKEKVVKEPKEKVVKEPKEKVVKEPKEKVVNNYEIVEEEYTKLEVNKVLDGDDLKEVEGDDLKEVEGDGLEEVVEEEEEVEAEPFSHNGVSYFIDSDNNLYHHESFDKIATFNPLNNSIILL
jgi:hypothetical protein